MKSKRILCIIIAFVCCIYMSVYVSFAAQTDIVKENELSDDLIDDKLNEYKESIDDYEKYNQRMNYRFDYEIEKNDFYGSNSNNVKVSILGDSVSSFFGYNDYDFIGNFYLTENDYRYVKEFLTEQKKEYINALNDLEKQAVSQPSKALDNQIAELKELLKVYDYFLASIETKCRMNVEDTWWMNFINMEDFSLGYNESLGGSCVTWDGKHEINQTLSSDARIDKLGINGSPDIIFIFGGINDILSKNIEIGQLPDCSINTFAGAYSSMLDKITNKYPNAKVICMIPYDTIFSYAGADSIEIRNNTALVHDCIIDICNARNITYIDLKDSNLLNFNSDFFGDCIHLNETGMKKVSYYVEYVLKNDSEFNKPKNIHLDINDSSKNSIEATIKLDVILNNNIEYKWYAIDENRNIINIKEWSNDYKIKWTPDKYGDYTLCGMVRLNGDDSTIVESSGIAGFHPYIKGICQMPYEGDGGGYLIGFESYDNPLNQYRYEMQILDCTLLANGLDAWIYTTDKCLVQEGKALWTIWQPQYGYYWTLFRLYDENDELLDQVCYGFVNAF